MAENAKKMSDEENEQSVFNTLIALVKNRNDSGNFWLELDQPKVIFNTKLNALFPNIFDSTVAIPVEVPREFKSGAVADRYGDFRGFQLMSLEQSPKGFLTSTMSKDFYRSRGFNITQFLAVKVNETFRFIDEKKIYQFYPQNPPDKVVTYISLKPLLRPDKVDDNVAGAETILREGLVPKAFTANAKNILVGLSKKYLSELITIGEDGTIKTVRVLPKVSVKPQPVEPKVVKRLDIKLTDDERVLLNCDQKRFNYEKDRLYDDGNGHWDIYDPKQAGGAKTYRTEKNFVARNPLLDVRRNGICAIDFGTKSTVVVCKDGSAQKIPLRIGTSKFKDELKAEQFENPTVEEFVDMKKFLSAYNEAITIGRPNTEWEHFLVSYTALGDMELHSQNLQKYYSFFAEPKQWAAGQLDDPPAGRQVERRQLRATRRRCARSDRTLRLLHRAQHQQHEERHLSQIQTVVPRVDEARDRKKNPRKF